MSSAQCWIFLVGCLLAVCSPSGAQSTTPGALSGFAAFDPSVLMTDTVKDVKATHDRIQALINTTMPALSKDVSDLQLAFTSWNDSANTNAMQWINSMGTVLKAYADEMNSTVAAIGPQAMKQMNATSDAATAFVAEVQPIVSKYVTSDGAIGSLVGELLAPLTRFLTAVEAPVNEFATMGAQLNKKGASSPRIMEAVRLIASYNQLQGDNMREYIRKSLAIVKRMAAELTPATAEVDGLLVRLAKTQIQAVLSSPLREAERVVTMMLKSTLEPVYGFVNRSGSYRNIPDPQSPGFISQLYELLLNATPSMLGSVHDMMGASMGPWMSMSPADVFNATQQGNTSLRHLLARMAPPELIQIVDALFLPNVSSSPFPAVLDHVIAQARSLYLGTDDGVSLRQFLTGGFLQRLSLQPSLVPPPVVDALKRTADAAGTLVPVLDAVFNATSDLNTLRTFLQSFEGVWLFQQLYSGDGDLFNLLPADLGFLQSLMTNHTPGFNATLSASTPIDQTMAQLIQAAPNLLSSIPHRFIQTVSSFYDSVFIDGPTTMGSLLQNATLLPTLLAVNTTQQISQFLDRIDPLLVSLHDKQATANQAFLNYTQLFTDGWVTMEASMAKKAVDGFFATARQYSNSIISLVQPFDLKLSVMLRVVSNNATEADMSDLQVAFIKWGAGAIKSQSLETQRIICKAVDIGVGSLAIARAVESELCSPLLPPPPARAKRQAAPPVTSTDSGKFQADMADMLQKMKDLLKTRNVDDQTLSYVNMLQSVVASWGTMDPQMAQAMSQTVIHVLQDTTGSLLQTLLSGSTGPAMMDKIRQILNNAEDTLMNELQSSLQKLNDAVVDRLNATWTAIADLSRQLNQFMDVVSAIHSQQSVTMQQLQDAADGKGPAALATLMDDLAISMTGHATWLSMWQDLNNTAAAASPSLKALLDANAKTLPSGLLDKLTTFQAQLQGLDVRSSDFNQLLSDAVALVTHLGLATQSLAMPPEVLIVFAAAGGLSAPVAPLAERMMILYLNSLLIGTDLVLNRYVNVSALAQMTDSWNEINKIRIEIFSSLSNSSRALLDTWRSYRDTALSTLSQYNIDLSRLKSLYDWFQGKSTKDAREIVRDLSAFAASVARETILHGRRAQCGPAVDIHNMQYFILFGIFTNANCSAVMIVPPPTTTAKPVATTTPGGTTTKSEMTNKLYIKYKVDALWNSALADARSDIYDTWNQECKAYVEKIIDSTDYKDTFKEAKNCTFSKGSIVMASNVDLSSSVPVDSFNSAVQTAFSNNPSLQTFLHYPIVEISVTAAEVSKPVDATPNLNLPLILGLSIPLGVLFIVLVALAVYFGMRAKKVGPSKDIN